MKIERNRKASSGQHSRHINIRYFFIKDRVKSGEVSIIYCTTDDMITNFLYKNITRNKILSFSKFDHRSDDGGINNRRDRTYGGVRSVLKEKVTLEREELEILLFMFRQSYQYYLN